MATRQMRFKHYTFQVNPRTLNIVTKRNIRTSFSPFMGQIVNDFGSGMRVITGEGAFHGDNAWLNYLELFFLYRDRGHGILALPFGTNVTSLFTSLRMTGSAGPHIIRYAFEFIEVNPNSYISQ